MFYLTATYIGIDPTAGEKPFVYAAIGHDLDILALGSGSIDDTLAFTAGQRQAVVAVCAPQKPNCGIMNDEKFRDSLLPKPNPGRWENFRYAEYALRQHKILIPQTSANKDDCPGWMRMGFIVYKRLLEFGYRQYPNENCEKFFIEVYPHACYTVLLKFFPFPKGSIEGRMQRQLVLLENSVNVPDPMRFFEEITRYRLLNGVLPLERLYSPNELDALMAAYTAWKVVNKPQEVSYIGDENEGQIVLPISDLCPQYHYR